MMTYSEAKKLVREIRAAGFTKDTSLGSWSLRLEKVLPGGVVVRATKYVTSLEFAKSLFTPIEQRQRLEEKWNDELMRKTKEEHNG